MRPHGRSVRLLDSLRFGIIITDLKGVVLEVNETAREIVVASHGNWPENATCCLLFGCNHNQPLATNCIASLAAESETPLPEVRVDIPPARSGSPRRARARGARGW